SGHGIYTEADEFHDVQTLLYRPNDLFRRVLAALQVKVRRTDGNDTRRGTAAIACGTRRELSRGVCALKIVLEDAVLNDGGGLGRHALIVKGARSEAGGHPRVVHNRYVR